MIIDTEKNVIVSYTLHNGTWKQKPQLAVLILVGGSYPEIYANSFHYGRFNHL